MYCPKCGTQNDDKTKFCRGCGSDMSSVLAVVTQKPATTTSLAERHIDLYSRGVRGVMLSIGFLIISGLSFVFRSPTSALWLFMMAFAVFFMATGLSRFVQAKALRALDQGGSPDGGRPNANAALGQGTADYIQPPSRSIYQTDNLVPQSVTERTTTHLEIDPEQETFTLPKR